MRLLVARLDLLLLEFDFEFRVARFWLCRFGWQCQSQIVLCATFNAQTAEHFIQIQSFALPSAVRVEERIVIGCLSLRGYIYIPCRQLH